MKNPQQEKLRISAKSYHQYNRGKNFNNGLIVRHLYQEATMKKLSWWDDIGFILNDYFVLVSWVHPRLAFKDLIEVDAHKKVENMNIESEDFLENWEPNYVKVGKSRKKIITHTLTSPLVSSDWEKAFNTAYAETLNEANYRIKPYIKAKWESNGRFVELCAPIEIGNENDLIKIANLARKLLKQETTLAKEFPNYVYTRDQWLTENQEEIN